MELLRFHANDPRGLHRAKGGEKRRVERHRNLAEEVTRFADADHALDTLDDFRHLQRALDRDDKRAPFALVHDVLTRKHVDVGNAFRKILELAFAEFSEKRESA